MVAVRYERAPGPQLVGLFNQRQLLHSLRHPLACTVEGHPVRLDVQFREGNAVALYCGHTCVLRLELSGTDIVPSAHPTYLNQDPSRSLHRRWSTTTPGGDTAFSTALHAYLGGLQVHRRWTREEGAVQVRWLGKDPCAQGRPPWQSIDREAVLGYADTEERSRALLSAGLGEAQQAVRIAAEQSRWAMLENTPGSNEVDQLGISGEGTDLVLAELKAASGTTPYYAPLQVMRYTAEWLAALRGPSGDAILDGVNALLDAKRKAGLLAAGPSLTRTPRLRPVVAFNEAPSAEVLERLFRVAELVRGFVPGAALQVAPLEVWCWPDAAPPRRLHAPA